MPSPSLHDISFDMEYATRGAREATFAPPSKRSKAGWPHKTPTPAQLAKAGFYYKPSPHSNDNTVCFLCDRNLDGWESEDDPTEEHLKHAEDCGWAVLMNVEASNEYITTNMLDPTGQLLVEARRATFAIGWPHESKRGWTCKTEKMVEAGWYFAPTQGSEDYVSCAYCKLSLDGWEPKDNPFEEHYSRSPSCPFFTFAGTTAPSKRPKVKKGRASRASRTSKVSSRLSTQSNMTLQSEVPSIPDLDESIDTSIASIMSTVSTATTKSKRRAGTSRAKTTKPKRTKTTKAKKEETPELDPQAEISTQDITYPQLQTQQDQQLEKAELPLDVSHTEALVPTTTKSESPEPQIGPPRQPSPVIPALVESPIPAHTRTSQARRSTTRKPSIQPVQPQNTTPEPHSSPSQPSDIENAPPSTRPESIRPPLQSPGTIAPKWDAVDVDMIFEGIISNPTIASRDMSDGEKQMTVQEWVKHLAEKAEDELRIEGEKVVGLFEAEGRRALAVLEGIACL